MTDPARAPVRPIALGEAPACGVAPACAEPAGDRRPPRAARLGALIAAGGLALSFGGALPGCDGTAASGPPIKCRPGLVGVWVDEAAGVAECQAPIPSFDPSMPTGLMEPFPAMIRPPGSLNTPERIELGMLLFFDPVLSGDNTVACASCHHPQHGFSDGRAVSTGIGGKRGTRSAPTVWNAAFSKEQFWDGRAQTLEEQAKGPIENPVEMAEDPQKLIAELRAIPEYVRRFDEAFSGGGAAGAPSSPGSTITLDNVAAAIATFERTLISANSAYDRYAAGDPTALNAAQKRGWNLYRSVGTRCFECHGIPNFANRDFKVIGVPAQKDGKLIDGDRGRALIVPGLTYEHAFKVPTLRNITKTAPYMHNGVFDTLEEVLDFYAGGGGIGHGYPVDNLDDKVRKFELSSEEKADLIAFMEALTDETLAPPTPQAVPSGLPVPKGPLP